MTTEQDTSDPFRALRRPTQLGDPARTRTARELPLSALYRVSDGAALSFDTTDALEPLNTPPGQERAVEALELGLALDETSANIFALAPPGFGKLTILEHYLKPHAERKSAPDDWVYVYNFDEPRRPKALALPAGRGCKLRDELDELLGELRAAIPAAFEGGEFQARREAAEQQVKQQRDAGFRTVEEEARARNLAVMQTPNGIAIAPIRDGQPVPPEQVSQWSEAEREQLKTDSEAIEARLQELMKAIPKWERAARNAIKVAAKAVTQRAVHDLIEDAGTDFADLPDVIAHLAALEEDAVRNANAFLELHAETEKAGLSDESLDLPPFFFRYRGNLVIDNCGRNGAPIVFEDDPTFPNLFGAVEYRTEMGNLVSDFSLIKPGSIHAARGGYLLIQARKLLENPYAYEALKRTLRSAEMKIRSLGQIVGTVSTASLEPEPIPVDVKVILMGDRSYYYILSGRDPEFDQLFPIAADFSEDVSRDGGSERQTARVIADVARRHSLPPFENGAVARLIENSARRASSGDRLSVHGGDLLQIMKESAHRAAEANAPHVTRGHVDETIQAQKRRLNRAPERMREEILKGSIVVDVDGAKVGQINGLSVSALGRLSFGRPARITATARLGAGKVIDIERETDLGGPIHTKGVLILQRFLAARYAPETPLSMSASLVFEQSYGLIDGDSASSTELYALLSTLAGVPIQQGIAVTGSVNQRGEVQAIGGVNEKIEGFFDVCEAEGLTGGQGVMIPVANVRHLMLREDVRAAVEAGRFHVYAVTTIDEGVEILTGHPAGERGPDGTFPADSVNGRVEARLIALAEAARAFARKSGADTDEKDEEPSGDGAMA